MMKNMLALLVIVGLSTPLAAAQATDDRTTTDPQRQINSWNGGYWNSLTPPEKVAFLLGFYEGLNSRNIVVDPLDPKSAERDIEIIKASNRLYLSVVAPNGLDFREMIKDFDGFYSEGSNRPIPISSALIYVAKKASGASVKELEEYARMLRGSIQKKP